MYSKMNFSQFIALMILFFGTTYAQSNGELRLDRNGDTSYTITSGRLQIYLDDQWGNICDTGFGIAEATVACQQLTYDGALSFQSSQTDSYGTDDNPPLMDEVTCVNSNFLHILQCDYTTPTYCSYYVSVQCSSNQIWSSPRSFDVRLQSGQFLSQGRVDYYLSDDWNSVCPSHIDQATARIVCQQLGYTEASEYNQLQLTSPGEPIVNQYTCCTQTSCFHDCLCESVSYAFCDSEYAATVQCNFIVEDKGLAGVRHECDGESSATLAITLGTVSAVLATIVAIIGIVVAIIAKSKGD